MASGTLTIFNKISNTASVNLTIEGTFNIEDNLNDTPSNMKVKVVTGSTYREEFEVNTVAYHEDTDTWWVIKADTSTYITTGQYEHEIELVEYLEFYAYKHLPNCAFAPNTYTLEQMLDRLFDIAKLSIEVEYANFLDKDKIMPFMSFENYTVANAIKTISRAIDAIPKMYVDVSVSYEPTLYFINRVGLDTAIVETLNTQFPTQYEKNRNSSDQFTTRSIANIQNAKSSNLVISPKNGGYRSISPNSLTYDQDTARVFLPSKIDSVKWVRVFPEYQLIALSGATSVVLYEGYLIDKEKWEQAILDYSFPLKLPSGYTAGEKQDIADELPSDVNDFQQVDYEDVVDKTYNPSTSGYKDDLFYKKMSLLNKFEFDTLSDNDTKDRTIHWTPFTNELVMPLSFRNGLSGTSDEDHNGKYRLFDDGTYEVYLIPKYRASGFFANAIPNENILIQVGYYPIADIKVSIDNDNDAQDEKFFNQNGKVIDALSASKLVFSHTQDSVEGTKIRNARYDDLDNVLPLGQLVRDGNDLYIVTQRSLDLLLTDDHEWVNVIYTLSRNRIARSENITADSSVISYKIPDDNLVYRTQLYKDYIELSLTDGNNDTPYLSMSKALVLDTTLAGTNFDYTCLAKNDYGNTPTIVRYVKSPSIFDLHKAKLLNINWQDNNVLGFSLDSTGASYVQTPIVYTDSVGKATDFQILLLDTEDLVNAREHFDDNYTPDPLIPFTDLTDVDEDYYDDSVLVEENYSVKIDEADYDKDAFEIPVFEYMIQANDDYNPLGNIVVGNDLFSTFTGSALRYHYVINNTTRFTAENANRLYTANPPSASDKNRVIITRTSGTQIDLQLFSTYTSLTPPLTLNTSDIVNVGIFATDGTTVKFLFGINDYNPSSPNSDSAIRIFINNWKI